MNIEGKTDKQLQRMVVAHWGRMLKLTIVDIKKEKELPNTNNCAFCNKYIFSCVPCPVALKTGIGECRSTPYKDAYYIYMDIKEGIHRRLKTFHKAVQKMIDFLKAFEC